MSDAEFEAALRANAAKRKKRLENSPVRETKVENAHVKRVEARGGIAAKWVSPGWAGVPDRIDLLGLEPMLHLARRFFPGVPDDRLQDICKTLLAAAIQFTELKRPGEKPEPHQARVHALLRKMGFTVNVIDRP